MRRTLSLAALVATLFFSANAWAGVWFELLHAPCWTGSDDDINEDNGVIGEYNGAVDCFNKDFNGDGARTVLTIKAFQAWEYGTMFLYYDITGPFSAASIDPNLNEKGGFFGGISVTVSPKQIAEKLRGQPFDWGVLANVSLKYEVEHVSKFGALHYYGLQWDLAVPFMDFVSATTVVRDDRAYERVDLQLGAAWQKSFSLASLDFLFGGFFSWGVFGEGDLKNGLVGPGGNWFFITQPQLLWDFGKVIKAAPAKLYLGFEYQFSLNRYLIEDKSENLLQGMIRWNI